MVLRRERSGTAWVLTIDRPERRNAIGRALAQEIAAALADAGADPAVRAVVLAATGDVFVAGGDLREFSELPDDAQGARGVLDIGRELRALEACPLPVIAAVGGNVLGGGCELLLLCDLVVIEQQATIEFRHAAMGLAPAWGGSSRLVDRVGSGWAAALLMTGERLSAERALAIGLVQQVAARGAALPDSLALAERIARHPRRGVEAVKRSLLAAREARRGSAAEREREVFEWAWGGAERKRALAAFRRKR